jgi:hypothetical protein
MAVYTSYIELKRRNTPRWPDLMPEPSLALRNPVLFWKQFSAVYKLNSDADSTYYREKMNNEADDYKKARMYRRAHGLPESAGLTARWGLGTVEEDDDDKIKREEEEERLKALEAPPQKKKNLFGIWSV